MLKKNIIALLVMLSLSAVTIFAIASPVSKKMSALYLNLLPMPPGDQDYRLGEFVVIDLAGKNVLFRKDTVCSIPVLEIASNMARTKQSQVVFSTPFGALGNPFRDLVKEGNELEIKTTSISPIDFLEEVLSLGGKQVDGCEASIQQEYSIYGCLLIVVQTAYYAGETRGFATTKGCQIINFEDSKVRPGRFPKDFRSAFGVNLFVRSFHSIRSLFVDTEYH